MSHVAHPKKETTTSSAIDPNELKGFLQSIAAIAGPAPALTSKDRKRTSKLRKGIEKVIPTLLALSDRIGLQVPSHPTSAIQENLDKVKTLAPVHESVTSAEKHLGDAIFQAQSAVWEGATVHYTVLRRLARTNGDVANALAPVTEFFSHKQPAVVKAEGEKRGHRKGVKGSKTSSTTTAAPTESTSAQAPAAPAAPPAAPAATAPNAVTHS